jgi:acyl-CoA reductase-like NAD-dependent aldehyde dehydrogenase
MSDYQLLIDGKLVDGDQTMPVLNPATEEVLASGSGTARAWATSSGGRSTPISPW